MNKQLIIYVIGLIGLAGSFGHTLKLYLIWMTAFITGNDVTVAINNYNEATRVYIFSVDSNFRIDRFILLL